MVAFIQTMEGYQYSVGRLMDLFMTFFVHYSELMKERASVNCLASIEADEGNPLTVHNMTDYSSVLAVFHVLEEKKEEGRLRFPKSFSFTSSFIECCDQIRKFIDGFYQFCEGFHHMFSDMDEILKKGVEDLMTKRICGTIDKKLALTNIQLSEIVRIILNLEYFEQAVVQFEGIIMDHRASHRISSPRNADLKAGMDKKVAATLSAACATYFRTTRKKAENRIFEVMNRKIDDFLDCTTYDFMLPDPSKPSSPTKPSAAKPQSDHHSDVTAYLQDLISFLTTVWTSTLAELPMAIKSFVYYDAIYHISSALLAQLANPNVKKISPLFVEKTLDPDVAYLEQFVKGLGDANLLDQLAEIKQAIVLLRLDTPVEEFLNPTIKSRKYSRLSKQTACMLLEKLRDSGAFVETGGFFGLSVGAVVMSKDGDNKKFDKAAKRKNLDLVIRTLKEDAARK